LKKSSDSGFQTNKSSKTRFNTKTDDSAVEIAASDIAAAIFETRKNQKASKESNVGLYQVQSGIPVRISSEKIIDHSREFITTTDDFDRDFNVKQARNDLLAQIDADLLTIYNQIQEIDERYAIENEEKAIINKISETVTSRISSVHVNPTINSEVLENLSIPEDEFEVKLKKGITIKPETIKVSSKPKPEYLSLNLDSCDRIDKYKSEMLDFQRASRFKRQQTARLQVLGKNINYHAPDPFVTFDLAGEQVLDELVGFSVEKFEDFLEQLTTDLWNEEFAVYEMDDETLVDDDTVDETVDENMENMENSRIPSKNFTALLKHSISIEETIEQLENTLKIEESPKFEESQKQKSDFSKKIRKNEKILEISFEGDDEKDDEKDDETMNETDIASFSMSPKEESNELGPMNSTFRTPTASSRPSVFQTNSGREITNSNGTSNSLQPLQPVSASSISSVIAENPIQISSLHRETSKISSVKSERVTSLLSVEEMVELQPVLDSENPINSKTASLSFDKTLPNEFSNEISSVKDQTGYLDDFESKKEEEEVTPELDSETVNKSINNVESETLQIQSETQPIFTNNISTNHISTNHISTNHKWDIGQYMGHGVGIPTKNQNNNPTSNISTNNSIQSNNAKTNEPTTSFLSD